jgi:alpha-tubulin suppressor-like RCC1 family protein
VQGNLRFRQITAGSSYTCGLTLTNEAYCWGLNYRGALGIGTEEMHVLAPRRVAAPL